MLDVTVKTLDGKNRTFSVPDEITVKEFKEKIAASIEISAETQRLIFQGRVLQDDNKLNDSDVNGKTLHVVQRPPPQARVTTTEGDPQSRGSEPRGSEARNGNHHHGSPANSFVLGSFTLPSDVVDPNQVQNIVQQVLTGMGDVGRNARVNTRASSDGSSVDVHINLGQVALPQLQSESQNRITVVQRMLRRARHTLNRLENPPAVNGDDPMETSMSDHSSGDENGSETQTANTQTTASTSQQANASMATEPVVGETADMSTSTARPSGSSNAATADIATGTVGTATSSSVTTTNNVSTTEMATNTSGAVAMETTSPVDMATSTTAEAGTSTSAEAGTGTSETTEAGTSTTPETRDASTGTEGGNGTSRANRAVEHPAPPALGTLLGEVFQLNQRLQPHLERYRTLMNEDPAWDDREEEGRSAQRICNLVSEILHYISHAYHSISDLMVDMSHAPPRQLRAPPQPQAAPSAVIQQTIPVQAQINLGHMAPGPSGSPRPGRRPQPYTTTHPTSSTSTATSAPGGQNRQGGRPMFGPVPPPHMNRAPGTQPQGGHPPPQGPTPPGPTSQGAGPTGVPLGNPYVFMEVGPQAVSINSISAQVVTLPSPTEASNQATNSTAPGAPSGGTGPTPATGQGATPQPGAPPQGQGAPPPGAMPPGFLLPPEVLQNIIHMSMQGAMRPQAPQQVFVMSGGSVHPTQTPPTTAGQNSSTSSTTTTTTSSASASAGGAGGSTGGVPHGVPPGAQAFVIPGLPPWMGGGGMGVPGMPGGSLPGLAPLDPYLPCHSRHLLAHRAAQAARQASAQPNQVNGERNPEQTLAGVVGNLVSGMINQQAGGIPDGTPPAQAPSSAAPPTAPRAANPFQAMFSPRPAAAQRGQGAGAARQGGGASRQGGAVRRDAPLAVQLRDLLQQGQQAEGARNVSSQPQGTGQSQTPTQAGVSDEVFAQLVSGIGGYVSRAALGQQQTETISDFLTNLGQNYNINQGEGLLTDIFNCISRHLTFVDLMSIFFGNPTPLNRVRVPLQQFIREKILQGAPYNDTTRDAAVERLLDDMQPEIEAACEDVTARDDIDFQASLTQFARHHLRSTLTMVMSATEESSSFGPNLYQRLRNTIHEFVVLSRFCLEGGTASLDRLVQGRVRVIANDINPMIQQWMVSVSSQQLAQLLPTITTQESQILQYVVHRSAADVSPQSSDGSFMSAEGATNDVSERMSVGSDSLTSAAHEVAACNPEADMDIDVEEAVGSAPVPGRPNIPRDVLARLALPPGDSSAEEPVTLGSQDWHSVVPRDWVPVITRDVSRQRRTGAQPPYSDAYMNGMPAKRRKIYQSGGDRELANLEQSIPEAIQRAAKAVGAQPITSEDRIANEARANTSLHSAFQEEITSSIQHRLQSDPDFTPAKYPNAENYFNKKSTS